jgi:hypothetical protein
MENNLEKGGLYGPSDIEFSKGKRRKREEDRCQVILPEIIRKVMADSEDNSRQKIYAIEKKWETLYEAIDGANEAISRSRGGEIRTGEGMSLAEEVKKIIDVIRFNFVKNGIYPKEEYLAAIDFNIKEEGVDVSLRKKIEELLAETKRYLPRKEELK